MQIGDEKLLIRLVAARLDLPASQRLLDHPFKLSVIKRCLEDQLRLKRKYRKLMRKYGTDQYLIRFAVYLVDDFVSDTDLYIACLILQKQIEHINGNKDNIVIPSKKMQLIREREQAGLQNLF